MADRVLVIGDIHGCDIALDVLLDAVSPGRDDTLVVLGDAVDRGPNSRAVIERLLDVQRSCRLVFLLGNHEEMMLACRRESGLFPRWMQSGGAATLSSYGGRLTRIPATHWEFLESAQRFWETSSEIFVHANLEPGVALNQQSTRWLCWKRLTGREYPHPSGKRVICGHTGQASGLPAVLDGWVCLDTLVYRGLFLTCVELGPDLVFQSRQSGELRHGVALQDLA